MLDRTIKSFSKFSKSHPDAMLFLHTDPYDLAAPFDMISLINRYKLNNRIIFSGMQFYHGFTYKEMNEIYNLMDIFLLTTSGEGFGIPIIEAMACEVPVVVTDYTTTKELLIDNGICGIPIDIYCELTGSWNVERAIMNDDLCVKSLEKLYDNPELRKQMGKIGREKVNKFYNWDIVGKQWCDLVEGAVK
jgi:L-malate glycosyltransferase